MRRRIRSFMSGNDAATAVEYALIGGFIALAIIVGLIANGRLSQWRVALVVPTLIWTAFLFILMHRVSYTRIYMFVALVAFMIASAGLAGWPRVRVMWASIGSIAGRLSKKRSGQWPSW